ncbi:MAG: CotH kinase family protein, partial [Paludibacteraceae bacterium]|nr:CotH kinase family protein [Paludibacteraceae bacterium]
MLCVMVVYALPVNGMSKEDSIFNERCKHIDWPILYIVTRDSVLPTFTRVEAPEGCDGIGITNNEKVPGRMVIVLKNDTVYDSGEYKKDTAGMTIRVRGNSSAYYTYTDKKPYKIKLEKKCDLLFRGNENLYADKDWVLLRHALCETLVGNMVNRAIGMEWTPAEQPVFVFLNDSYWGVYMLTENVKRSKCRVDIDKDGYLFEYDAYWWNEDFHIESRYYYNYTL